MIIEILILILILFIYLKILTRVKTFKIIVNAFINMNRYITLIFITCFLSK